MKEKCTKCGKERLLTPFDTQDPCRDCRDKSEFRKFIMIVIAGVLVVIGIRLIWAKFVYNDYRCFLAECRITK